MKSKKSKNDFKVISNNPVVEVKKHFKKLSKMLEQFKENITDIDKVNDDERKIKVQAISGLVYDLTEVAQDLNILIDGLMGDDLIHVDDGLLEDELDNIELINALMNDFEKKLKNFHKTFYNKLINAELKLLSFHDFTRSWNSIEKRMLKIISGLNEIVESISEL
ncbi:MAG: hypothetical protein ACTSVI_09430 [Promethearchaeota archaeon]